MYKIVIQCILTIVLLHGGVHGRRVRELKSVPPADVIYDAIVIGAGMSGASAASRLKSKGLKVLVLEGRNRIGGRTYSIESTAKGKNIFLEMGANWIHGIKGNPLVALAAKAGVELSVKTTNYQNSQTYYDNGQAVSDAAQAAYDNMWSKFSKFLDHFRSSQNFHNTDPGLMAAKNAFISQNRLTQRELDVFDYELNVNIEHEWAGPISNLSLWFDDDYQLPGGDKLVLGGYQHITGHLLQGVPVLLNHIVTQINYTSSSNVIVNTSNGKSHAARSLVVTLPLGVLKAGTVKFVPDLPKKNRDAIAAMGMGLYNKCILVFPYAFWDTSIEFIERIAANGTGAFEETLSLEPAAGLPVLYAFNAADYADSLELKSDSETLAVAMTYLRRIWPSAPSPTAYYISRWRSDPFARGSYSFTSRSMRYTPVHRNIASPLARGRVQFAGEHTRQDYPATVHGAYLSGQHAACNILTAMGKAC